MRRHSIATSSPQQSAAMSAAERNNHRRKPWRLAVVLLLLGFQHNVAACGGSSGPSCLDAGSLCARDDECCSGRCRCQDMTEWRSRCT
jgi:hypothetical protein